LAAQPDLNWRNPRVRAAIHDVMRFWFSRGVDGFRVDVIWHLIKDDQFRDNPDNPAYRPDHPPHHAVIPLYTADRPEVHDIIGEMRRVTDEFPDRVLIGEIYLPIDRLVAYYGRDLGGVHLPFNFALLHAPWNARAIAKLIDEYEGALPPGGWPNWVLGNHDRPRIASRVGVRQAPVAAMPLLTLRGTPTIYYGDEIGLEQARLTRLSKYAIPQSSVCRAVIRAAMVAARQCNGMTRDTLVSPRRSPGCRSGATIMKETSEFWRGTAHRSTSFTGGCLSCDARGPLLLGSYRPIVASGDLLLFVRERGRERMFVALNMGAQPVSADFQSGTLSGQLLLSSEGDREGEQVTGSIDLRGDEGVVINLSSDSVLPNGGL
jgi:alpha-glucosidase